MKKNTGSICTPCDPGSYSSSSNSSSCTLCPANTYDNLQSIVRSDGNGVCFPVPIQGYSAVGSTSYNCNAGYFVDAVYIQCSPCATGKPFFNFF